MGRGPSPETYLFQSTETAREHQPSARRAHGQPCHHGTVKFLLKVELHVYTCICTLAPILSVSNYPTFATLQLEKYSTNLEAVVAERTSELAAEKARTEELVCRMLPKAIATQLTQGKTVAAESFECVTIYFR